MTDTSKQMDSIALLDKAAQSVLAGDRARAGGLDAKGVERYGGGQKLANVERVEVLFAEEINSTVARVYGYDGNTAQGAITQEGIYAPKDRAIRPGDVHDAVRKAMLIAAANLQAMAA